MTTFGGETSSVVERFCRPASWASAAWMEGHMFTIGEIDERVAFVNLPKFLVFFQVHFPGIVLGI